MAEETQELKKLAKLVLHDMEIELEAKVGSMEHDVRLIDCVVETLAAAPKIGECSCECRVCSLADHSG